MNIRELMLRPHAKTIVALVLAILISGGFCIFVEKMNPRIKDVNIDISSFSGKIYKSSEVRLTDFPLMVVNVSLEEALKWNDAILVYGLMYMNTQGGVIGGNGIHILKSDPNLKGSFDYFLYKPQSRYYSSSVYKKHSLNNGIITFAQPPFGFGHYIGRVCLFLLIGLMSFAMIVLILKAFFYKEQKK